MPKKTIKSPRTTKARGRKLAQPTYRSFRLSKRIKQPKAALISSPRLLFRSLRTLWQHWRLFSGILAVYLFFTTVFVVLQNSLSTSNSTSDDTTNTGPAQVILFIFFSLLVIWALRHTAGKKKRIRLRDCFYKSTQPLVPFMLVLVVVGLQLIPLLIANFLYETVLVSGLATTPIEKGLWLLFLLCLAVLSLYMVSSSIFSLYIVTLPDVLPMQALRSARDIVRFRRQAIVIKIVFLIAICLSLGALLIVPVAVFLPQATTWEVTILSLLAITVIHSYLYHLYRELL